MNNKPRYCWDTSVFLAWLNAEPTAPLADIERLVDDVHANRAIPITSVVTYTEMLRARHTAKQIKAFDDFLKRSNVVRVEVSFAIAQKAEEIRSKAITLFKKGQQRTIKTPDAQIIATAILQKANVLHSLEPQHCNLSGHSVVDGLLITLPRDLSGQKTLNLS